MKRLIALVLLLVTVYAPAALGHATAIALETQRKGATLEVQAFTLEGAPVGQMQLAYWVEQGGKLIAEGQLTETTTGTYQTLAPSIPPGPAEWWLQDSTPGFEPSKISTLVQWPLTKKVGVVLPPSASTSGGEGSVFVLMLIPVLLAGGALGIAMWTQRRRGAPQAAQPDGDSSP